MWSADGQETVIYGAGIFNHSILYYSALGMRPSFRGLFYFHHGRVRSMILPYPAAPSLSTRPRRFLIYFDV